MKKIIFLIISFLGIIPFSFSQGHWGLGGNNGFPPPDGVNATNNILGTNVNISLRVHTNSTQRLLIRNGGTTNADGRVAMGNNLAVGFIPRSRLHLHHDDVSNISLRFSNSSTGTGNGDGFIVGYRAISAITNRQYAEMNNFENTAMKFLTNNTQRMHINASVQSNINGYTVPVPGFVGIGGNTGNIWGDQNNVGTGPFSLLHLNDVFGNLSAEQRGYRPWMKTGISYTTNEDFAYVGYRSFTDDNTATGNRSLNRNEFNITWSNNEITSASGSDDMAFRFTNRVDGANGMPNVIDATNLNSAEDLDGRHIARFTAIGNMGLGATFGEDHPVYVKPQSLLHMSKTDTSDTWLQITNQTGTGQTANDGLRIGITTTGTAHIRQQENLPLIFYTGSTEDARIIPASASTLPLSNHGMLGIGNWTTAFNIIPANVINAKLDIDGDLRIRTVTKDNTLTQILAIDPTDHNRVHWIDAVGGIGNNCSDPQNPLTSDYEIPLGNQNYYFTGQGAFARVAIGVPCTTPLPISKFVVFQQNAYSPPPSFPSVSIAGQFMNSASGFLTYGITSEVQSNSTIQVAGVFAATAASGVSHVGVYGRAWGGTINRAGYFDGDVEIVNGMLISDQMFKTNVENIKGATDVLRKLRPHTYKMDVTNFPQFTFQDRMQYGFIAQEVEQVLPDLVHESMHPGIIDSTGNFTTQPMSYKSLNYNALIPITVQAVIELNERLDKATLSDQNVKTNVQNLANSLDKVKQMRGVSYEWSSSAQNDMNLDSLQHIGFIAQEITAIEPLLTFTDDSSLVHVNYDRVAPLLVESVKELDTKNHTQDSIIQALDSINNDLETRLTYLENCIRNANICTEGNRTMNTEPDDNINNRSVELVNTNSIILDQNLPNPFAENTVINYNIPTEVVEAKLLFYDLNGRIIKELIIEERGESKLTVYGTNLKTGVYTYSLIADGELIATKKMVKK